MKARWRKIWKTLTQPRAEQNFIEKYPPGMRGGSTD
jgi:hypothetical protein